MSGEPGAPDEEGPPTRRGGGLGTFAAVVAVTGGLTAALALIAAGRLDQCGLSLGDSDPFHQDGSSRVFYWLAAGFAAAPFVGVACWRRRHLDVVVWLAAAVLLIRFGFVLVGQVDTRRLGC